MEAPAVGISDYIFQLSKELNIQDAVGVFGHELKLISLVKNLPLLYDKYNVDFKNKRKKEEGWKAIAQVFNVPVDDVRLRWTNMRDRFNKYNKGKLTSSVCPYYEEMKFIEPYIFRRRRYTFRKSFNKSVTDEESNGSNQNNARMARLNLSNLIEAVKKFPVLYSQFYKNDESINKMEAWKIVSETVRMPVEVCMRRWKNLTERYAKEKCFYPETNEQRSRWELFGELSFLDEDIPPPPAIRRKYEVSIDMNATGTGVHKEECLSVNEDEDCIEFVDTSSNLSSNIYENLQDYSINMHSTPRKARHEDDLFGQAIAAELKRMPNGRKKRKLKAEIYKLLYEYTSD